MKYTEFKENLTKVPRIFALYDNEDLVLNNQFELFMKKRLKPSKPHLKINETLILKATPFDLIIHIIFRDAIHIVFAKENYDCRIPEDVFNIIEKDIPDREKKYLKYELGLKQYNKQIADTVTLIQTQMLGRLIELVNVTDYTQALHRLGIQNVDSYIDFNPTYTD